MFTIGRCAHCQLPRESVLDYRSLPVAFDPFEEGPGLRVGEFQVGQPLLDAVAQVLGWVALAGDLVVVPQQSFAVCSCPTRCGRWCSVSRRRRDCPRRAPPAEYGGAPRRPAAGSPPGGSSGSGGVTARGRSPSRPAGRWCLGPPLGVQPLSPCRNRPVATARLSPRLPLPYVSWPKSVRSGARRTRRQKY